MERYSQEERARQLEEWKQSGMIAWAYAKSLNPQTFNKWTKRGMKRQFVEITAPIQEQTKEKQEILIEKGEVMALLQQAYYFIQHISTLFSLIFK